jgi:hypothetical protein
MTTTVQTPEVPFADLTADSSRDEICKAIPNLYWFHRHKNHFCSQRWKDQYNAITSYAHDRGYPRGDLETAYEHYRARVMWLDRHEGMLHPHERPTLTNKKRRRREEEVEDDVASTDSSPSILSSASCLSLSAAGSSPAPSPSPGSCSSIDSDSTACFSDQDDEPPSAPSPSILHNDPSLPSHSTVYDNRTRALQLEVEELRGQLSLLQQPAAPLPPMPKYARYHPDTKLLEGVYNLFRKHCGTLHGADVDIASLPEKRAPGRATVSNPVNADLVSTGYAECTLDSFDKICHLLEEAIEPVGLRMGADSVFLDIGSGYGKCVLHARFRVNVRKSMGIEYVRPRHTAALEMLERHVPQQSPVVRARLQAEDTIELFQGDATMPAFSDVIHEATHIFMFDVLFSPDNK